MWSPTAWLTERVRRLHEPIRVTPSFADWSQATSEHEDVPSGMTDVLSTPGGLYLLNGQAVRFALGTEPDPFELKRYTGDL